MSIQLDPSSPFVSLLEAKWQEKEKPENCQLYFNLNDIKQAQALIQHQGRKFLCSVKWRIFILSKEKLKQMLLSMPHLFDIRAEIKAGRFKIYLSCKKIECKAQKIIRKINQEIFTHNPSRLLLHADWCNQPEDQLERQAFLVHIIQSAQSRPDLSIAATNAITILNCAHYPLSKLKLRNIDLSQAVLSSSFLIQSKLRRSKLVQADLARAFLSETDFRESDLRGANFEFANLDGADWRMCRLADITFKRLPILIYQSLGIISLALSLDDQLLAVGEQTIHIWDLKNSRHLHSFDRNEFLVEGEQQEIRGVGSLAFSPNGKWLASADIGGKIAIWEMSKYTKLCSLLEPNTKNMTHLAFSCCSQFLAVVFVRRESEERGIIIWQLAITRNNTIQLIKKKGLVCLYPGSLDFSPIMSQLLTTSDKEGEVVLWDLGNIEPIKKWNVEIEIKGIKFSKDGSKLLVYSSSKIFYCNMHNSNLVEIKNFTNDELQWLDFNSNNSFIYLTENKILNQYDVENQRENFIFEVSTFDTYSRNINCTASNTHYLVCGTQESPGGKVYIWNIDSDSANKDHFGTSIIDIVVDKDEQYITLLLSPNDVYRYCLASGHLSHQLGPLPSLLTLPPANDNTAKQGLYNYLSAINQETSLFLKTASSSHRHPFHDYVFAHYSDKVSKPQAFAISDDQLYLVILRRYSLKQDHHRSEDRVEIWDYKTNKCLIELNQVSGNLVALSPSTKDGFYLAVPNDSNIRIWHLQKRDGLLIEQYKGQLSVNRGDLLNLLFTKDGKFLFSSSHNDLYIRQWDVSSLTQVRHFRNTTRPWQIALNEKSSLIAISDGFKKIEIRNLLTDRKECEIEINFDIQRIYFSEKKAFLILVEIKGISIHVWKLSHLLGKWSPQFCWRLPHRLSCKGLKIHPKGALPADDDLSELNRTLLLQLGAQELPDEDRNA